MEARLKAILEMESSQMQKELVAASNNLKKFERELAKATDTNQIQYLQRSIGILKADIDRMTQSANGASKAMGAVGGAMKSSQMNTQNFARVIQDLPFGFMGIQNNLTQLVPGIGAAGLAFSALTAAITFSQVGLQYWGRSAKQAKEQADEFLTFSQKLNESAGEEISKAKLLYDASQNVAIAMSARIRAAKELKDLYPETFKNYTAEDIALGKAANGYKLLTSEIISNARARAAAVKIGELEAKILDEELKKTQARQKAETAKKAVPAAATVITPTMGANAQIITQADRQNRIELNVRKEIADVDKTIVELRKQQSFYTQFGGGATAVQNAAIPAPEKEKVKRAVQAVSQPREQFQMPESRGKWWRNTQTERGNDLSATPNIQVSIDQNKQLNQLLAEQADIQAMLNEQLAGAAEIAEYGGQVFGQMFAAMINGGDIGEVIANAFKQIAIQIAAAVAQALIFAALLEAFPALKGVFGTVGAVGSIGQGAGASIGAAIRGQDIQLSQRRTSTGMGFRRGRR